MTSAFTFIEAISPLADKDFSRRRDSVIYDRACRKETFGREKYGRRFSRSGAAETKNLGVHVSFFRSRRIKIASGYFFVAFNWFRTVHSRRSGPGNGPRPPESKIRNSFIKTDESEDAKVKLICRCTCCGFLIRPLMETQTDAER